MEDNYYISQIAVSKSFQQKGIGSMLFQKMLEVCNDFPIVASVEKNNVASIRLLSKFMIPVNQKNKYIRYVVNINERGSAEPEQLKR